MALDLTDEAQQEVVRDTRGKLFIYLRKQLLPTLQSVIDTPCEFKALRADIARQIVQDKQEKGFVLDLRPPDPRHRRRAGCRLIDRDLQI